MIIFEHGRVVLPETILEDGFVAVEQGCIAAVGEGKFKFSKAIRKNLRGKILAPGFVDLHVHGALGRDAMEANLAAWNVISRYHAGGGTTAFTLSAAASAWEDLERVLKVARKKPKLSGAELLGIHAEGPYLSKQMAGAQDARWLRTPLRKNWARMLKYAEVITQVTLAPELRGSMAFIRALKKCGILPSAGHTAADESTMQRARAAGLNHATHLLNRMASVDKNDLSSARDAVKFILENSEISAEIIADGIHIPIPWLKKIWRTMGEDRLVLVTDATAGAGLKTGARFQVGKNGVRARVCEGCARTEGEGNLAGSTMRMIDAVRVMVEKVGVPLHDAVRMASYNPAKKLHLENEIGSLHVGKRADVVILDTRLHVLETWIAGNRIV